jgi:hypothetical protein
MPHPIVLLVAFVFLAMMAEAAGGWLNLLLISAVVVLLYVLLLKLTDSRTVGSRKSPRPSNQPPAQVHPARPASETIWSQARGAQLEPIANRPVLRAGSPGMSPDNDLPKSLVKLVPNQILHRSGSVFYSGRSAFQQPSRLYVLGLNPGGSPTEQWEETVERDLSDWLTLPEHWSAYKDESWRGRPPGTCGMQPRVLHMFSKLGLDAREVPASNVIFTRSSTEATLEGTKGELLPACWRVHQRVIDELGVDVLLCFGGTAGRWVREMVRADRLVDQFAEANARGWRSTVHQGASGKKVVTVTHPGRADWRKPDADPSELVIRALRK